MKLERFNSLPTGEIMGRIRRASEAAHAAGLSGLLILQHVDLYYFTGTAQRGALFIPAAPRADRRESCLLSKTCVGLVPNRSSRSSGRLQRCVTSPTRLHGRDCRTLQSIGLELDVLPAKNYLFLSELFSDTRFHDASGLIRRLRAVKTPLEKKLINRAARQLVSLFAAVPSFFVPNAREIDIAIAAEAHLQGLGHQGIVRLRAFCQELFYGVVVSGPSGAVGSSLDGPVSGMGLSPAFPQGASPKTIGENEPVLLDMVGAWGGYLADGARLFYRKGLPPKAQHAYAASLEIQETVVDLALPGPPQESSLPPPSASPKTTDYWTTSWASGRDRLSYIGHGIGLEVDESPVIARGSTELLVEGNVFALEPKFVFVDVGAVGVENTFYLGPCGARASDKRPPGAGQG